MEEVMVALGLGQVVKRCWEPPHLHRRRRGERRERLREGGVEPLSYQEPLVCWAVGLGDPVRGAGKVRGKDGEVVRGCIGQDPAGSESSVSD